MSRTPPSSCIVFGCKGIDLAEALADDELVRAGHIGHGDGFVELHVGESDLGAVGARRVRRALNVRGGPKNAFFGTEGFGRPAEVGTTDAKN